MNRIGSGSSLWIALALAAAPCAAFGLLQEKAKEPAGAKPAATSNGELARRWFERFKRLEGRWQGRSTKGWTDRAEMKLIAHGSVLMHTSFDAHPGETMVTMFHLDGERLMLTHYCVAGNQPRLVATAFGEDGDSVTFTFLDATNLASRDQGHMDQAVYRFTGDDHFTSRWTWYQDGKESWMEEIESERDE